MDLMSTDESNKPVVRLVCCHGTVECEKTSVRAQHFLKDFPKHSICHAKSLYINRKTPVLDAFEDLRPGNLYFMLPKGLLESPLTLPGLLSLSSCPRRVMLDYHPLVLESTVKDKGFRLHVSEEFVTKLLQGTAITPFKPPKPSKVRTSEDLVIVNSSVKGCDDEENKPEQSATSVGKGCRRLCSTHLLQKEYERLVCSKLFKHAPRLETIMERDESLASSSSYASGRRRISLKFRHLKGYMTRSSNRLWKHAC